MGVEQTITMTNSQLADVVAGIMSRTQAPAATTFLTGTASSVVEVAGVAKASGSVVGTVAKYGVGIALGGLGIYAVATNWSKIVSFVKSIKFKEVIVKAWDFAKKTVVGFGRWIKNSAKWLYNNFPPVTHVCNFFHKIGRWLTGKGWTLPSDGVVAAAIQEPFAHVAA